MKCYKKLTKSQSLLFYIVIVLESCDLVDLTPENCDKVFKAVFKKLIMQFKYKIMLETQIILQ